MMTGKEAGVACLYLQGWQYPGWSNKNHDKIQLW